MAERAYHAAVGIRVSTCAECPILHRSRETAAAALPDAVWTCGLREPGDAPGVTTLGSASDVAARAAPPAWCPLREGGVLIMLETN